MAGYWSRDVFLLLKPELPPDDGGAAEGCWFKFDVEQAVDVDGKGPTMAKDVRRGDVVVAPGGGRWRTACGIHEQGPSWSHSAATQSMILRHGRSGGLPPTLYARIEAPAAERPGPRQIVDGLGVLKTEEMTCLSERR